MVSYHLFWTCAGEFSESSTGELRFGDISGHLLERVCAYLCYKAKHERASASSSAAAIPEFEIKPEIALELLMAANYLDC